MLRHLPTSQPTWSFAGFQFAVEPAAFYWSLVHKFKKNRVVFPLATLKWI